MTGRRKFYADLLERVTWTAVQSFLAALLVDSLAVVGLDGGDKVKIALSAAGLAVAKCLLATKVGASNTAATLPVAEDTERGEANGWLLLGVLAALVVFVVALAVG